MKTLLLFILLIAVPAHANDWRDLNTEIERSGWDTPLHVAVGVGTSLLVHKYSGLTG
jgi:hypothetical protein